VFSKMVSSAVVAQYMKNKPTTYRTKCYDPNIARCARRKQVGTYLSKRYLELREAGEKNDKLKHKP
jgi:hypothetical protein